MKVGKMKCKIVYVKGDTETVIENKLSFKDFCVELFSKKIYLSIVKKGVSLAINTDNILYVEEIK